jgi:hypothetical protein
MDNPLLPISSQRSNHGVELVGGAALQHWGHWRALEARERVDWTGRTGYSKGDTIRGQ